MRTLMRPLLTLLVLPPLLLIALLAVLQTDAGRRLLEQGIALASDERIRVEGLMIQPPARVRIARLEARHARGTWLTVDDLVLDLRPGALLSGALEVGLLSARRVEPRRLPMSGEGSTEPLRLPATATLIVHRIAVDRIDLNAWRPDVPALAVLGNAALRGGALATDLSLTTPGRTDRYELALRLSASQIALSTRLHETPGGLLAALGEVAGMPLPLGSDDLELTATALGSVRDLSVALALASGALHAEAHGRLDLIGGSASTLLIDARLPALDLVPWGLPPLVWDRLALSADLAGHWSTPQGHASLTATDVRLGAWGIARLSADLVGGPTRLDLDGTLHGPNGPPPLPAAFATTPTRVHAALAPLDPTQPILLSVDHPLVQLAARAVLDERVGEVVLTLPDLATLGALHGQDLAGRAQVGLRATTNGTARLDAHAELGLSRAPGPTLALLGPSANLTLSTRAITTDTWRIDTARLASTTVTANAAGQVSPTALDLDWTLDLRDLGVLAHGWSDALEAHGGLTGHPGSPDLLAAIAGHDIALGPALTLARLDLNGRLSDPLGRAETEASLIIEGSSRGPLDGTLSLDARGPIAALELSATSRLGTPLGPAALDWGARLDTPRRTLVLGHLDARLRDERLILLAPATLDLNDGARVDRLALGLATVIDPTLDGTLTLSGRPSPPLDLDLDLDALALSRLARWWPNAPPITGQVDARLRLAGSLAAPTGTLDILTQGVRLTEGQGRAIPPGELRLAARLHGAVTELEARAAVPERADLRLDGRFAGSLSGLRGALDLRARGDLDLALFDPLLAARGRRIAGRATLETALSGTLAAPRLNGTIHLEDTALRDHLIGLSLTAIEGRLRLLGDTLSIERLTGRSGRGRFDLAGQIGVLDPDLPVDLRLDARDAHPVALDLLEIEGDLNLHLTGRAQDRLELAGRGDLSRILIRLPERLPAEIPTLEVRERGQRTHPLQTRPTRGGPLPSLGLDLDLNAPAAVRVSGLGIDAELGGALQVRGALDRPRLSGGLSLTRGQYSLAGQTLRFTRGRIGFAGVDGLDADLDLEARVTAAGRTALLLVQGSPRAPRILLRGEPEMSDEEILSRLLFGVPAGRLSTLQAVRLGRAAMALAGVERGPEAGVLGRLRDGFGLDRLDVDSDARGSTILEGGRYLTDGLFIGARQDDQGTESRGILRMDIIPRLRLEADLGDGGGVRGGTAFEIEY